MQYEPETARMWRRIGIVILWVATLALIAALILTAQGLGQ